MISVMTFPTRIVLGEGAVGELPEELRRLGIGRPLVVTDSGIAGPGSSTGRSRNLIGPRFSPA